MGVDSNKKGDLGITIHFINRGDTTKVI